MFYGVTTYTEVTETWPTHGVLHSSILLSPPRQMYVNQPIKIVNGGAYLLVTTTNMCEHNCMTGKGYRQNRFYTFWGSGVGVST
jgi:hypothetical protein